MLFLAKIRAAIRPEPSAKQRAEVHERARILAAHNAWLTQVLDHHDDIEAAFEDVQAAITPAARREAQHWLATLLTGHSLAEEASIYPEIARRSHAGHSAQAFHEQGATKLLVARLEKLDPASPDYVDELARLHTAVTAHTYWEERDWFPALRQRCDAKTHLRLLQRYRMRIDRYVALETLLERVRRDSAGGRSFPDS